jgi:MFS transporter, DHA1 family, staphyloferrin A biosynthesis exporter
VLFRNLRTFKSLANPNFRLYFINNLLNQAAGNMQGMARSLLVYRLTDSALLLGLSMVITFIPVIIFSPIGGILADRFKKKYIVIGGNVLQIVMALILAIPLSLGYLEADHPASWWILGIAFLLDGSCMGLTGPSFQSMVREIVDAEQVMNAVALGSLAMNILRFIAPLATGFILSAFGFATVFYIMAILYFAGAVVLAFIPAVAPKIENGINRARSIIDIKGGFTYIRSQPTLLIVLAFFSVAVLLSMPYGALLPIFSDDILKVGDTGYGMLISASGVGATLVSAILASVPNKKRGAIMLAGSILLGVTLAGFAFSKVWFVSLALIFLVGLGDTVRNTVTNALLLYYSEHAYWGRVMSVQSMIFGSASIGVLLASIAAEKVGVQWVIGSMALVLVLFSIAITVFVPRLRRLD